MAATRCAAVDPSENNLETDYQQILGEAAEFRFAAMHFVKYALVIQWTMRVANHSTSIAAPAHAHCDRDGLLLADQHDQPLASGHAGVQQVPLQHDVVLGQHGDHN